MGLVVVLTAAAAVGLMRLQFDDVPRSVFRIDDENFDRLESVFQNFGSDDNDCLLVVQPASARAVTDGQSDTSTGDHLFTPSAVSALRRVITELKKLEGFESVRSLQDVVTISSLGRMSSILPAEGEVTQEQLKQSRQAAVTHPLALGQLISPDAATSLIVARMPEGTVRIGDIQPYLEAIRQAIDRAQVERELWIRLTGIPTIRVEIYDMVRRETRRFVVLGVLLATCMSLMLFRRPWPVLIVSLAPMLGSLWTLGAMGLLNQKMNIINTIVPTLVMIVGFTDAVHLMHHLRDAIGSGASPLAAAGLTVRHLWKACLMTSLTTAVGFGSLVVAQVEIIRSFGAVCAVGSMLAFLAVILVVPLLASTSLGNRLAYVSPPNPNAWTVRFVDWIVDQVLRHHRLVTVTGVVVTGIMFVTTLYLRPDNRLTESIPDSTPSAQALAHCDRVLGGILMGYALVQWDDRYDLESPEVLSVLESAQKLLDEEPGTSYPMSVVNLLRILPGKSDELIQRVPLLSWVPKDVTRRFVRNDLRQALISVHLPDTGTSKHLAAFEHLETQFANLSRRYPGIQVNLTGSVAVAGRNINLMIVDLANSILTASVIIFGCLAIGFRSWLYGLISILPNVFPLVLTGTVLVVLGLPLQLIGVIVFSICLGIAVDDTIHFLARFQRELLVDHDVHAAIRRAFHAVGGALVTTTLVLLAGFGVVLTSEMPSSRQFAWMSCTAILAALIGDLLILPSLLAWFAKPQRLESSKRSASEE